MDDRCHSGALPVGVASCLKETVRVFVIVPLSRDKGVDPDLVGCVYYLAASDVDADMGDLFL